MALNKDIPGTSRFMRLLITDSKIAKDIKTEVSGKTHHIQCRLELRDHDDSSYLEILPMDQFRFNIPTRRVISDKNVMEVPKLKTDGTPERNEDGFFVMETVENGTMERFDTSYVDPFDINIQNQSGVNVTKIAYEWILANIPLFADFYSDET